MDTKMSRRVAIPFKKINPDKIARYIFINRKKLHGIYYLPKYWYLIRLIADLLPANMVQKISKMLYNSIQKLKKKGEWRNWQTHLP